MALYQDFSRSDWKSAKTSEYHLLNTRNDAKEWRLGLIGPFVAVWRFSWAQSPVRLSSASFAVASSVAAEPR